MKSIQDRIKEHQDRIERDEKYSDEYLKLMSESYDHMLEFIKDTGLRPWETDRYLYYKKNYKSMRRRIRNRRMTVKWLQEEMNTDLKGGTRSQLGHKNK